MPMSTAWESLANEPILDIQACRPGKPPRSSSGSSASRAPSSSRSTGGPFPPSDRVLTAVRAALTGLNRYPDGSGHYLRRALAAHHKVSAESIVLGNGFDELIELLARTFVRPGEEVVIRIRRSSSIRRSSRRSAALAWWSP